MSDLSNPAEAEKAKKLIGQFVEHVIENYAVFDPNKSADQIAAEALLSCIRRAEIREEAEKFFEENRSRIFAEVMDSEVEYDLGED